MPYAVWPRTPKRHQEGVVVEGPSHLIGKHVWGSSGDLGIKKDGSIAQYLVLSVSEISEKPGNIPSTRRARSACLLLRHSKRLRRAGNVKAGDVVLVMGGNGKVGQAAIQLATMNGARVFAAERVNARPIPATQQSESI